MKPLDEGNYRLSFVRLNDELVFQSDQKIEFLSNIISNIQHTNPSDSPNWENVEFIAMASVQTDDNKNQMRDFILIIKDKFIHLSSLQSTDLQIHKIDIRYKLIAIFCEKLKKLLAAFLAAFSKI